MALPEAITKKSAELDARLEEHLAAKETRDAAATARVAAPVTGTERFAANLKRDPQSPTREVDLRGRAPVTVRTAEDAPDVEGKLAKPGYLTGITTGQSVLQAQQPGESRVQGAVRGALEMAIAGTTPWVPGLSSARPPAQEVTREIMAKRALKQTLAGLDPETRIKVVTEAGDDEMRLAQRVYEERAKQFEITNPHIAVGVMAPLAESQVAVADSKYRAFRRKNPEATAADLILARAAADREAAEEVGRWRLLNTGQTYYVKNPERLVDSLMSHPWLIRMMEASSLTRQQGIHNGHISKWEAAQSSPMSRLFRAMVPAANTVAGAIARTPSENMAHMLTGGLSSKPWYRTLVNVAGAGPELAAEGALQLATLGQTNEMPRIIESWQGREAPEDQRGIFEMVKDRRQTEIMLDGVDMLAVANHLGEAFEQDPFLQKQWFTPIAAPLMRRFSPSTQGFAAALMFEVMQPDPVGISTGLAGKASRLVSKGAWVSSLARKADAAALIERNLEDFARNPRKLYKFLSEHGESFKVLFNAKFANNLGVVGTTTEKFILDGWETAAKFAGEAKGLAGRAASARGTVWHFEAATARIADLIEGTTGLKPRQALAKAQRLEASIPKIDEKLAVLTQQIDAMYDSLVSPMMRNLDPKLVQKHLLTNKKYVALLEKAAALQDLRIEKARELLAYLPARTWAARMEDLGAAKAELKEASRVYKEATGRKVPRDPAIGVFELTPEAYAREVERALRETAQELGQGFKKAQEVVEVFDPFAVPRLKTPQIGTDAVLRAVKEVDEEGVPLVDKAKLWGHLTRTYGADAFEAFLASGSPYAKILARAFDGGDVRLDPKLRQGVERAIDEFAIYGRTHWLKEQGLLPVETFLTELRDPSVLVNVELPSPARPVTRYATSALRQLRAQMHRLSPNSSRYATFAEDVYGVIRGAKNFYEQALHEIEEIGQVVRGKEYIPAIVGYIDSVTPIRLARGFTHVNGGEKSLWLRAQEHLGAWFDITELEAAGPRGVTSNPAFQALAHMWLARGATNLPAGDDLPKFYAGAQRAIIEATSFEDFVTKMRAVTARYANPSGAHDTLLDDYDARAYASAAAGVISAVGERKMLDMFGRAAGGFISEETALAFNKVLTRGYGSVEDLDAALELAARLGMPITRETATEKKLARQLLQWGTGDDGEKLFAPVQLIAQYNEVMTRKIKELSAYADIDPTGNITKGLRLWNQLWKETLVGGLAPFVDLSYPFVSIFYGDAGQVAEVRGPQMAIRVARDALPGLLPGYGRYIQQPHADRLASMQQKFGDVPILGSIIDALFNPQLNQILASRHGAHTLGGRRFTTQQLYDLAGENDVLETQVSADVMSTFERAVKRKGLLGSWQWLRREISMYAHQLTLRLRMSQFIEELKLGIDPVTAGKRVNAAQFDWKHGFSEWEVGGAMNGFLFYRYWKLALRRAALNQIEGFVKADDPDFWARAFIGQTALGRQRQMHLLGIRAPKEAAYSEWLEEHKDELDDVHEEEEAVFSQMGLRWSDSRGGTSERTPDDVRLYMLHRGQRDRVRTFTATPEIGTMGALSYLTTIQAFGSITAASVLAPEIFGKNFATNPYAIDELQARTADFLHPAMTEVLAPALADTESGRRRVYIRPNEAAVLRRMDYIPGFDSQISTKDGSLTANERSVLALRLWPGLVTMPSFVAAYDNPQFARGVEYGIIQGLFHLTGVRRMYSGLTFEDLERMKRKELREMRYAAEDIEEVEEAGE